MVHQFVHLRVQSSYSMLESALQINNIVNIAQNKKMPALCIADRGNLFGSLEFALAATKARIQPIHGSILNIKIPIIDESNYSAFDDERFAEILLIAKDEEGYKNLLKLVSYTFTKNDRKICNHIVFADLIAHNHGIIALSCYTEGIIGQALIRKDINEAIFFSKKLQDIFGNRFYFEIMRHNDTKEQKIEQQYLHIAADLSIALVATNRVLFSSAEMHDAHNVLLRIATGVVRNDQDYNSTEQYYFKSSIEMINLFEDLPSAIENTVNIARRCSVMSETHPPMLPNFATDEKSEEHVLRQAAAAGLFERLANKFKYEQVTTAAQAALQIQYNQRLNYELDIICKMNFSGYFLIVSDFIKWSKQQNISVGPGRGSGAGSIVAWSLLITDVDPIKFGLLFERFLNPERISMPDFDIDFCQERREEVINYVRSKYGDDRVGQIITFGRLQAKSVIKDVSRVKGLDLNYSNRLSALVPFNAITPVTLSQAIEEVAELKNASKGKGLYNVSMTDEAKQLMQDVLSTSLILEGLHRHASVHAAGIIIAGKELVEIVPVYKDIDSNMLVVQYSMKYADLAGLMKFDFLGLQTLTIIRKCQDLLQSRGTNINFDNMLFDDSKTYEMLSRGLGVGVFQFESPGMKDTLRRLKPDCIEDLIALGALYRPGPMENIPTYIACKHGRQNPNYLHPLLEPLLKETYGVIIYQEQVLEIAKILAGYTLGAADLLRKAMGKKIKAEMTAQEEIFITGAKKNKIPASQAKSIFVTLAKFAGYGFNKAHASAYSIISYQTAYLKANYLIEFLIVCLNLEIDNFDKINLFMQEAKNNNLRILPPDINLSCSIFSIYLDDDNNRCILYALGGIKNVTKNFGNLVLEERTKNGPFKDIIDLVERIPQRSINRRLLEHLIKAGCFDSLHTNRNQLLQSIGKILAYSTAYHNEQASDQISMIKINTLSRKVLIEAEMLQYWKTIYDQFDVMGLFIDSHPLSKYKNLLSKLGIKKTSSLWDDLPNGSSHIKIAGMIQKKDARMSARGRFITLQLSDQDGIFDLTIFNEEVLRSYAHLLDVKSIVVAGCEVFKDEGGLRITATHFSSLDEFIKDSEISLKLLSKDKDDLTNIVNILQDKALEQEDSTIEDHAEDSNPKQQQQEHNIKIALFINVDSHFVAKVDLGQNFHTKDLDLAELEKFNNNYIITSNKLSNNDV
ncbi:MAG: DNA polymerase III subunit alpha [Rickettsiaceae bacterium]|nr:MAG: DNA polymerase III subunit alpha [Rickettsiaceae bacterium]